MAHLSNSVKPLFVDTDMAMPSQAKHIYIICSEGVETRRQAPTFSCKRAGWRHSPDHKFALWRSDENRSWYA